MRAPATLTVMPDYGNGPFLWIQRHADQSGIGGNCCDATARCGQHPMSEDLWCAFVDWTAEFERTSPMLDDPCWRDWDWMAFHRRGLRLAERLKREIGDSHRVVYLKPSEDPNDRIDERREVLADGSLLPLSGRGSVPEPLRFVERINSGGQTGVDRAALDFAIDHRYLHGGYCPKGRKAEDGRVPVRYQLVETDSEGYRQRTKRNIESSDATLILNTGELAGGSLETWRIAERSGKPIRVVALDDRLEENDERVSQTRAWLRDNNVGALNVAGPREGKRPGVASLAYAFLDLLDAEARN